MAKTLPVLQPTLTQSLELAAYTATPVLMLGIGSLVPQSCGFVAMVFSWRVWPIRFTYCTPACQFSCTYPEERGFIYARLPVVTAGLILMVVVDGSNRHCMD